MKIPDRSTIRHHDKEKIKRLGRYLSEDDISKIYEFGIDTALWYLENVTSTLFPSNWDLIFRKKRKTDPLIGRKLY